jgi:hypothetical protein
LVDHVEHEPGQMVGRQPVAQVGREQEGLVGVAAQEVVGHAACYRFAPSIPNANCFLSVNMRSCADRRVRLRRRRLNWANQHQQRPSGPLTATDSGSVVRLLCRLIKRSSPRSRLPAGVTTAEVARVTDPVVVVSGGARPCPLGVRGQQRVGPMSGTAAPPGWDTTRECTQPSQHLFSRLPWCVPRRSHGQPGGASLPEGEVVAPAWRQRPGRVRGGAEPVAGWLDSCYRVCILSNSIVDEGHGCRSSTRCCRC